MSEKKLVAQIDLRAGSGERAVQQALEYSEKGVDALIVMDLSDNDESHEDNIGLMKQISRKISVPLLAGGRVKRVEDVKKYLYAGASQAILDFGKAGNIELLDAVSARFGKDKLIVSLPDINLWKKHGTAISEKASGLMFPDGVVPDELRTITAVPAIVYTEATAPEDLIALLKCDGVSGLTGPYINSDQASYMEIKACGIAAGLPMKVLESAIPFSEFKLNQDGLIPVITQDYQTGEVLMLAYMNEASYEQTIRTGKMTYYSRSRQELWVKGLTSGHLQYVKSLSLDCDKDTILANVYQVGAACHTGARSCFYTPLTESEAPPQNPLQVFESVYETIDDRKKHPKEGSYTNYLFDKGIDKILKKVGEEATEIIIAAKNPDAEEIKYEIADFLYHAMVLMVEKGVSWEDITDELARRH